MYQATKFIYEIDPEAVVINTPSDQFLEATDDDFAYTVKTAVEEAENGYPVLIGVTVNDLVTAMGCGHAVFEDTGEGCYTVTDFVDQPDEKLADKIMRRDTGIGFLFTAIAVSALVLFVYSIFPHNEEERIKKVMPHRLRRPKPIGEYTQRHNDSKRGQDGFRSLFM